MTNYTINFLGKVYSNNVPVGNEILLGWALYPNECFTGWSGYYSTFLGHKNSLISFVSDDGHLTKTTVTFPFSEGIMETIPTNGKTIHIRSQKLVSDDFALFWLRDTLWLCVDGLCGDFYCQNGTLLGTRKILDYSQYNVSRANFPLLVTSLP